MSSALTWLKENLGEKLSVAPETIDENKTFSRMGIEPMELVAMVADLSRFLQRELPSTLGFDCPTARAMTDYVDGLSHGHFDESQRLADHGETTARPWGKAVCPAMYQVEWIERALSILPDESKISSRGKWLILNQNQPFAKALFHAFKAKGLNPLILDTELRHGAHPKLFYENHLGPLFNSGEVEAMVYLAADTPKIVCRDGFHDCAMVFHLVQQLLVHNRPARLWLLTNGAEQPAGDTFPVNPHAAALWGLAKVVGLEHPEIFGGLIDLPGFDLGKGSQAPARVVEEILNSPGSSQVVLRKHRRYVPRLMAQNSSLVESSQKPIRPNVTYLITGGTGGLGQCLWRWLIGRGATHLVITGRKAPSNRLKQMMDQQAQDGVSIRFFPSDAGDERQLRKLIQEVVDTMPPLAGVFHLAGIVDGGLIAGLSWERFVQVLAAKAEGSWALHTLTREFDLEHFVMFSSVASLLGAPGQSSYASANAFMDGLARLRQQEGLPALSINWGPWAGAGMAARLANKEQSRWERDGIFLLKEQEALDLLETLMSGTCGQTAVMAADWGKAAGQYLNVFGPRFFDAFTDKTALDISPSKESTSDIYRLLQDNPGESEDVLSTYLQEQISGILRLSFPQVPVDANLMQLGLDSLLFLELSQLIEKDLKIVIPSRSFIQAPYINSIIDVIMESRRKGGPDGINTRQTGFSITPYPEDQHTPFELTDIQHAYWIGRSGVTELGDVACHIYFEIDAQGLDLERYTRAWQQVIARHAMLRAVVLPNGRQQVLENLPPFQIPALDLGTISGDARKQKMNCIRDEMSHQVRPADQWPLFEVRATLLGPDHTLLHISMDILIADGYSIYNLMKEIDHYYRFPDQPLAPVRCTFRDYVLAESVFRKTDKYRQAERYWLERLETLPACPELPLDRVSSELKQTRFIRREARLDAIAWKRLQSLASRAGLTRANVLLAAYAQVLAAWSKSSEFTLNLTFFHRLQGHPQINEIIGDFTSLILLQVAVTPNVSFEDLTLKIQAQLWEDMEHRYFSGVRVLRELSGKNHGGARSLMPVVFTSNLGYENIGPESSGLTLPGEMVYGISQTPQVWIDNQVSEMQGDLVIVWDAVDELFPAGMLDHMFNAYHALLVQLTESENAWHAVPDSMPPAQALRRNEINSTDAPLSNDTLISLFEKQVAQQPGQTALLTSSVHIRYETLQRYAVGIASMLLEKWARPHTFVAVVMEKGWEQVAAVLGILNTGAAYVPIDPAVPRERLWHLLKDLGIKSVLTQSWLDRKLDWPDHVHRFAVDTMEIPKQAVVNAKVTPAPEDLAYVIHTSGSTGLPKGVMIDHKGAVNTILDINRRFQITRQDAVLALSNLNFDLSVYDIFGTLAAGGTIVMPDNGLQKDPGHWLTLMKQGKVTIWNSVPALMQMLVEYVMARPGTGFDALRLVLLSGDWIPLDLPDKIRAGFDSPEIISLGGATEASIWSVFYPVGEVHPLWKSIPYGRPMANQTVYVLNENMDPCPDWVPGQLYIGGAGLARGYWRDEKKTGTSFIRHPVTGQPLYRTGDLCRFWPDGNIEFLGREDQQVKISGYRIELGEIETAMAQCPGVKKSVAAVVTNKDNTRRIIGYVVPDGELEFSVNELKTHLGEKLAGYMVPQVIVKLEGLPLTPNGKVDRKNLPLPDISPEQSVFYQPENQLEVRLAQIIQPILKVDRLSTRDPFMNIGANSIDMVKIQNALVREMKISVSVVDIFEHACVRSLARFVSGEMETGPISRQIRDKVAARKKAARQRSGRTRAAI